MAVMVEEEEEVELLDSEEQRTSQDLVTGMSRKCPLLGNLPPHAS